MLGIGATALHEGDSIVFDIAGCDDFSVPPKNIFPVSCSIAAVGNGVIPISGHTSPKTGQAMSLVAMVVYRWSRYSEWRRSNQNSDQHDENRLRLHTHKSPYNRLFSCRNDRQRGARPGSSRWSSRGDFASRRVCRFLKSTALLYSSSGEPNFSRPDLKSES